MKVIRTHGEEEVVLLLTKQEAAGLIATAMDLDSTLIKLAENKCSKSDLSELRLRNLIDHRARRVCADLFDQLVRRNR